MTVRIEWTETSVPAEYTDQPGAIIDGGGSTNQGPALLIHSGSGDGACVEAATPSELIAWLTAAASAVRTNPGPWPIRDRPH